MDQKGCDRNLFMVLFLVLSRHTPGKTEKDHETSNSGYQVSAFRIETGTSQNQSGV
jgi:hypothetical protein